MGELPTAPGGDRGDRFADVTLGARLPDADADCTEEERPAPRETGRWPIWNSHSSEESSSLWLSSSAITRFTHPRNVLDHQHQVRARRPVRVRRIRLALDAQRRQQAPDQRRQAVARDLFARVRVELGPDVDELVQLVDRHHPHVLLGQVVEVLEDHGREQLHQHVRPEQLPHQVEDHARVRPPAPVAEVRAVPLVARLVRVRLEAVVHDAVPGLAGGLPEEDPERVVEGAVVAVGVEKAVQVLLEVRVIERRGPEHREDRDEEHDERPDVRQRGQRDDERLDHLLEALGAPDQPEEPRDPERAQDLQRRDPVVDHLLAQVGAVGRVDAGHDDGEHGDGDVEPVPTVREVPARSEPQELYDCLADKDGREEEVDVEHDGDVARPVVVRARHHGQHVPHDARRDHNVEPRVDHDLVGARAQPVLRADLARLGLELADELLRVDPVPVSYTHLRAHETEADL
eukprot:3011078-Rhodomonas_salina.3